MKAIKDCIANNRIPQRWMEAARKAASRKGYLFAVLLGASCLGGCGEVAARGLLNQSASEPHSTSSRSGAMWVYSPPVGASDSGRMIQWASADGMSASAGAVQDHAGRCPTDEVDYALGKADPIACVIAVASGGDVGAGPRLRVFLAQSPRAVPRDSPCHVLKKIYAGMMPTHLACARVQGAFFVEGSGASHGLPSLEALLARPGFFRQAEAVRPATDEGLQPPGDIFDVVSVIFRRPGYAGRINYSKNTGVLVDAGIIFWGE